jgi:hypothetical protein
VSETGGQQIAYGDALDAFPAWVSLDGLDTGLSVSSWRINRGRVDETQRTGTGTATIYVNDVNSVLGAGSDFPTHAQLFLRGSPRFRGHVDEINVEVHPSGVVSRIAIECVDLFDYLSTVELSPGVNGDLPTPSGQEEYVYFKSGQVDDRMIDILDQVRVPRALQSVFSGNVALIEKTYQAGTTAMQVLDECADSEWPGVSNRFIDSTGRYCFRGRYARFNPENPTYGISFWEAGTQSNVTAGRAQIQKLNYSTSRKLIVNSALAYPEGMDANDMTLILIEDATSQATYGLRSWSAENLLTKRHLSNGNTGADEAVLFSTYQVANYKSPTPRVERVQFCSLQDGEDAASDTWDLMCNAEIGDVIDIYTDWISGRYFIEGLSMEVREADGDIPFAVMDLDLSPAAFWGTDPF